MKSIIFSDNLEKVQKALSKYEIKEAAFLVLEYSLSAKQLINFLRGSRFIDIKSLFDFKEISRDFKDKFVSFTG
ncbi:MAG: hypothetical protein JW867_03050, partial [Candidatus Omnitrophica bacterium]|nr:hypothetical protein [Candidatus Omnitrophota bacterium]